MEKDSEVTRLELEKLEIEKEKLSIEKEKLNIERKRLDLEKTKEIWNFRAKIITVLVTVGIGTFGIAYMNHSFQNRQLEQQRLRNTAELQLQQQKTDTELDVLQKKTEADLQLQERKAEAERRQAEMKYLGDFLIYALEEDHYRRLRFAEYFATLSISPDLQSKWEDYYKRLQVLTSEFEQRQIELAKAQEAGEDEKIAELQKEIERIKAQLAPLPQKLSIDRFRENFELDSKMQPRNYTENNFEDLGEVVIDHNTNLMWQKEGSDRGLTYANVQSYIEGLNRQEFAGYNDWRLPTTKELMTLVEEKKQSNGLYIDPVFDSKQKWCWTADEADDWWCGAWAVYFDDGHVYCDHSSGLFSTYVRGVRSY